MESMLVGFMLKMELGQTQCRKLHSLKWQLIYSDRQPSKPLIIIEHSLFLDSAAVTSGLQFKLWELTKQNKSTEMDGMF